MKRLSFAVMLLTFILGSAVVHARFIDALDTTNNFFGEFGGVYASNTSPGEVTLFKTASGDAGINWQNGGAGGTPFSLSTAGDEDVLVVTPVAPVNGGYYSVQILFFSNGNFVSESSLIPDTNSIAPQTNDIAAFAQSLNINATDWFPRIRVLPNPASDSGFTFTELAAIPEPSALMLLPLAALLLMRRHRV